MLNHFSAVTRNVCLLYFKMKILPSRRSIFILPHFSPQNFVTEMLKQVWHFAHCSSISAISFIDDDCYAASAAVADKSSILFVIIDAAFLTSSRTVRMNFASSFRFWSHDFR